MSKYRCARAMFRNRVSSRGPVPSARTSLVSTPRFRCLKSDKAQVVFRDARGFDGQAFSDRFRGDRDLDLPRRDLHFLDQAQKRADAWLILGVAFTSDQRCNSLRNVCGLLRAGRADDTGLDRRNTEMPSDEISNQGLQLWCGQTPATGILRARAADQTMGYIVTQPAPLRSATCPRESVLPIRLRPDFSVVFEGYAGGAVNRATPRRTRMRSLRADILRTC
ncbi:hypothetical protein SAMN05443999_11819 [Roseovarius azorensis]|uniref:Uncharacterized protein n=1 Tax=Roseovarius azorensis TaxID=1287727 RepID=A0A1H7X1A5_9RHOB|nr:hypothetical protein SAMN05443999_11819 [Roseovarius azorensis]